MKAETAFTGQIEKIKRRVVIRAIHGILLNASLIFLIISTFFIILPLAGLTTYPFSGAWYFISIGLSLSAALIIGYATRSNVLNAFIEIDQRLRLQDRLSTAYEYLKLKNKTEFSDLLMRDAVLKLQQFSLRQLVPARFSPVHLAVIILLIINAVLYSGIFQIPGFKSTRRNLARVEKAGEVLQNYMIGRIDDKAVRQTESQSEYTKELEHLSNKLNDHSKPAEQRLARLDSFLKEVQGEQTRLANELGSRLDSADIKDLPVQNTPDLANLTPSQLEKLKGILNKTLNSRVYDDISQNIESLQELADIEQLISRLIDDFKNGRPGTEGSAELSSNDIPGSQSTETPDNPPEDPNRPNSVGQFSGHRPNAADGTDNSDSEKLRRRGDRPGDEMDQPEGYSASAGNAAAMEEKQSSRELEKAPGSAVQDKPVATRVKSYLIQIRALTDIGEARVNEDEIVQTYRKEVESILQKEDMPNNYREYIKNYFISVGIQTEEKTHGSK